jgi:glycosyltransferase involved in cell wall biosynthesis
MKKKIAFYIESMVVGGAEKVLIDLVNNLAPHKFDITVIAIFKKSVYSGYEFQFADGFQPHIHYKYLIDNTNRLKYLGFNYLYNKLPKKWLYRFLIKDQYDIEVAFYEGFPTEFVSHSTQNNRKVAWLHIDQDVLYKDSNNNFTQNELRKYNAYNKIIAVSQSVKSSFEHYFGLNNIKCLYNPIDEKNILKKAEEYSFTSKPNSGIQMLTIGRLTSIKGYERLINVLGKLKKEGFEFSLLMIGDGELKEVIKRTIKDNNLEDNIMVLGHKSNPYPYLKVADCLISSSYQEGFGMAILEANILRVPVISTRCSSTSELIEDGITGVICENSEDGLYGTLRRILKDKAILYKIKENKMFLPTDFTLKSTVLKIEQMLENINKS